MQNKVIFLYATLICLILGCTNSKKSMSVNSYEEVNIDKIVSELSRIGIDSIVFYEIGCVGCLMKNENIHYAFYTKNSIHKCRKITNTNTSEEKTTNDIWSYFLKNKDLIESDTEKIIPYISHYWYKRINVFYHQKKVFTGEVSVPLQSMENDNLFVRWVNQIDGELMWILWGSQEISKQ